MALEFEDFVTGLTEETTPDNAADFLVIVDTSGSDVNKVKPSNLLGADLTAIKALSPSNDDVLQRKAGAWTNRTVAQVKTDLGLTGTNSGDQNTFGTVAVSGQSDVVADAANDTLTLAAGSGIAITTDASTDTVSIASTVTGNATHTGEVTGATSLTVDKTAITNKTLVTAAVGDHVLIADASDSDNLKKVTVQTIVDLAGGGIDVGDTIGSATAGSVFFAGAAGVMAQDNAGFFYDNANNQLKLTASAATQTPLQINLASAHSANAFEVKSSGGTTIASVNAAGRLALADAAGQTTPNIYTTTGTDTGIAVYDLDNTVCLVTNGAGRWGVQDNVGNGGNAFQYGWNANIHAFSAGIDTGLARTDAGIVKITNGSTGAGALHLQERTAPSAPATNNVYIYAEDNGAGKTRIVALFPTGAAQVLATEP